MFFSVDPIPERSVITSDERADSDSWTEPDQQSGDSPKLHLRSPGAMSSSIHSPPPISSLNANSSFAMTPTTNTSAVTNIMASTPNNGNYVTEKPKLGSINDQLTKVLPPDDGFPDLIVFVLMENTGPGIYCALSKCNIKVLGMDSESDLKVALPHIVAKVQKFCNNNAKTPPPFNIVVVGPDSFLSSVTKNYVTQLSTRPNDWQNYFSFLYAPFTSKLTEKALFFHDFHMTKTKLVTFSMQT